MVFLINLNNWINNILNSFGIWTPALACFLIVMESFIPFLPLSAFITINFITLGTFVGFLVSWIFMVIGCLCSFLFFRYCFSGLFEKYLRHKKNINKLMLVVEKSQLNHLILLAALPFVPAFLFNITLSLSNIKFKKYLFVMIFGKMLLGYFYGFIGIALFESLKNPLSMIKVVFISIIAYCISSFLNKKLSFD